MDYKTFMEEFDLNEYKDLDISHIKNADLMEVLNAWSVENNINVVTWCYDLDELETMYKKFMSQHQKLRRMADWESIHLYRATNKQVYDLCKSSLHAKNDPILIEGYLDASSLNPIEDEYAAINYTPEAVDEAIEFTRSTGYIIIYPTSTLEDLERLWEQFNFQIKKSKRISDWEATRLFGCNNMTLYTYLKSKFIKGNLEEPSIEDTSRLDASISESTLVYDTAHFMRSYVKQIMNEESVIDAMSVLKEYSESVVPNYDSSLIPGVISDVMSDYDLIYADVDSSPDVSSDLPFFDPQELIDFGVTSHDIADKYYGELPMETGEISIDEFFTSYTLHFNGIPTPLFNENASKWISTVRYLCSMLEVQKTYGNDPKTIARIKQTILEYGWNPELEFSPVNRTIANRRIGKCIKDINESKTSFIDMRSIDKWDTSSIKEMNQDNKLYPIYIVLVSGTSAFSSAIRTWTNSMYSHASISFDNTLKKMYSFAINDKTGIKGGFVEENIKDLKKDQNMAVYAIFVKKDKYNTIEQAVKDFQTFADKTKYSFTNIISILFNKPLNKNMQFICSQFVDSLLKLADIDITTKDSSLVVPEDFHKIAVRKENRNKKIYILFQGLYKSFNLKRIQNIINNLLINAKPVVESTFKDIDRVYNQGVQVYQEVKELPVRLNYDGDLIIDNPRLDFDAEYSKSHKLLLAASKTKNKETMKYELAKLWRMNEIIEKRLHRNFGNRQKLNVSRAHILNDLKKYLEEVLAMEPDFNFDRYYQSTPYGSGSLRINRPTLKYVTDMITTFLKSI